MKESNEEFDEDYNFNFNNIKEKNFEPSSNFNQNQIISPLRSLDNSPVNNNRIVPKESNNNNNYNSYNMKNKSFFNDDNTNNDDLQFIRYPLNDEQKKYLTPRNTTIVYKILDFLFNW